MNRKDLEKKLNEIQEHDEIAIKTKENKYEIVKTKELEITYLGNTFTNGAEFKDIVADSDFSFYEYVIVWTVAEHNGLHSYIIETTEGFNQEVHFYSVVFTVEYVLSGFDEDTFSDPFDGALSDFLDLYNLEGSWGSYDASHIIEFDILPQEWPKDENGDILDFDDWEYEDVLNIKIINVRGFESLDEEYKQLEKSEIIIEPKENKAYFNACDVLFEHGYKETSCKDNHCDDLYEKDGEIFKFVGMDHFNTEIYSVTIRPLTSFELQNV